MVIHQLENRRKGNNGKKDETDEEWKERIEQRLNHQTVMFLSMMFIVTLFIIFIAGLE